MDLLATISDDGVFSPATRSSVRRRRKRRLVAPSASLKGLCHPFVVAAILGSLFGCAPTNVQATFQRFGPAARPEQVIVYDFAVAPADVQLDRGLEADVMQMAQRTSVDDEKVRLGRAAARVASETLVQKLRSMGMPALRGTGMPITWYRSAIVEGQFISLSQGDSTERDLIGLGMGRSDVQARVQLDEATPGTLEKLESFRADAKSGYKPGMAETMGAGGGAGHGGLGGGQRRRSGGVRGPCRRHPS